MAQNVPSKSSKVIFDQSELARMIWIPCMPVLPEDPESWAEETAEVWWALSSLKPKRRQLRGLVRGLAARLLAIREEIYATGLCQMAFLHLPDPRVDPLPLQFGIWEMRGQREERLRELVGAGHPEDPAAEEITTDLLGTGLRYLRHWPSHDASGSRLSYAWRSESRATDLCAFTSFRDTERIVQAIPDIDALLRVTAIVPVSRGEHGTRETNDAAS
jgi:hypothetical protein